MHDLFSMIGTIGASLTPRMLMLSFAAIFSAAVLQGFTGFGFSLAAVPLLSLIMPPSKAVPIAIVLLFLTTAIEFRSSSRACHWPSLRWLMVGAAIGSPFGTFALTLIPAAWARLVISGIIGIAVITLGRGFTLQEVPGRAGTSVAGFFSGIFNGLAAMPGPPSVAFYMSVPLAGAVVRASLMVFFLMTSTTAIASSAAVGLLTSETLCLSLLGLPVMWLGTRVGRYAFSKGDTLHRHISIASLAAVALASAIKGIGALN